MVSTPSKAEMLSKYTPVGFVDPSTDVAYHLVGRQVEVAKPHVDALCCLTEISPLLYVTSAMGASLAANSAAYNKAKLVVVSICDANTCTRLRQLIQHNHNFIEHHSFVVPVDDYAISAFDFVMTFYGHARSLAVILEKQAAQKAEKQAETSIVVHCVMGMNRSCATIVFAQILAGNIKHVKALVSYLKSINKRVRLDVLENQSFVDHLVMFGEFAKLYGPCQDATLRSLATRFEKFCLSRTYPVPAY